MVSKIIDNYKLFALEQIFKPSLYSGVKRRFEYLFESEKFVVINDFAHHPTAIEKTLDKALSLGAEVYLIVEIGSNTMKSGYHDSRLMSLES